MISLGYTTIHDRSQISFDSSKVLIGKLAQLHATSFVLNKQMDTVSHLNAVYFDHHMDKSYCEDMNKCIEMMKKFHGFEKIVEQLEGTTEEMFEAVRNIYYNQDEAECKVLCHGDMKFENTLIKKQDDVVENGVFVRINKLKKNKINLNFFFYRLTLPIQISIHQQLIYSNFCIKFLHSM